MSDSFNFRRVLISLFSIACASVLFAASAQAASTIQFPVGELGGCTSKEECHAYCEKPENMKPCLDFAEKNGLMSTQELSLARRFVDAGGKGPGGCTTKTSCESFCDNTNNIQECLTFAEKSGMMSGEELVEARKVAKFLESGGKLPGGCRTKQECDSYCNSSNADHMRTCIMFAKEAGFMSEEEAKDVDKVLTALEKGVPPPRCRGDEECAVFCAQPENTDTCIKFSVSAGKMTEKEAEFMRKSGGKGPGGCVGKECQTYCDDPEHAEACFNFAKDRGEIPSDQDYGKMREGRDRFKNEFQAMPVEIKTCLTESLGGDLDTMLKGNPPSDAAKVRMEECWKRMAPQEPSQPVSVLSPASVLSAVFYVLLPTSW